MFLQLDCVVFCVYITRAVHRLEPKLKALDVEQEHVVFNLYPIA